MIHIGQSAGDTATVASGLVRGKQLTIKGYSNFGIPRDELVSAYLTMVDLATSGELTLPGHHHTARRCRLGLGGRRRGWRQASTDLRLRRGFVVRTLSDMAFPAWQAALSRTDR